MLKYQQMIRNLLEQNFNLTNIALTIPPDSRLGDIALPCFSFAKQLKKSPAEIAGEIKSRLQSADFIDKIEVNGGYLNFLLTEPCSWRMF